MKQIRNIFGILAVIFLTAFAGHAATITVNTLTDENNTNNGACSLREALNNANGDNTTNGSGCAAGSGTDDIVFSVSGTINLTAVLPDINSSMNIGSNTTTAPNLTVNRSSGGNYGIFVVNGGNTVTMNGLIITNGNTTNWGGGIRNGGTLTVNNCIVSNNNTTNDGAGIFNQSVLIVNNSSILNNSTTGYGAGIQHRFATSMTVNNSTFSGNVGGQGGGAIDLDSSGATINNSSFSNNSALFGGAITVAGSANIINCTFNANRATLFGSGGLYLYNNTTNNITNSTVAQNSVGGIGIEAGTTANLRNTIVAGNVASNGITPLDITGIIESASPNNLIGTGGAGGLTNGVNGNQTNVPYANVRLLPLGSYGGNVQTMPIRPNSPARNAGTNTGAPATDARGFNRPQAATNDIGAFEIQTNSLVTTTANSGAGSLRQAVADIASGDIIQFETPLFDTAQTISLSGGQITLGKNLTIYGNGANILTVQNTAAQSSTSRVFTVNNNFTVNLQGITMTGGNTDLGGGIRAGFNSVVSISNCHITGNTASTAGGGINAGNGTISLIQSTVSNNTVTGSINGVGGGIDTSGNIILLNSTVSGNSVTAAGSAGGGIWFSGTLTVISSTIANNSVNALGSASGIIHSAGTATVYNSIIASNQNNATYADVVGTFISNGYNLIGNVGTVTGFNQATDQTGSSPLFENADSKNLVPAAVLNPGLLPLALNGGTVPTHAFNVGSPAIDKGNSFGATTDARGLTRPVDLVGITNAAGGDGADIGAYESQLAPTAANVSISGKVLTSNGAGLVNAIVYLTDSNGVSRTIKTGTFGNYQFENVAAGGTYTIAVVSKKYQFTAQILSVNESVADLNFIAAE